MSPNIRKYYFLRFFAGFIFTYTIQSIFLLSRGITAPQLAVYASLSVIVSTAMEIPTGYIADRYGRKYSVALGYLLDGLVFIVFLFVHDFKLLVLCAILRGIAIALDSGAFESLIYEEIKNGDTGSSYVQITSRGSNIAITAAVVTTFLGPILYVRNPALPFILMAAGTPVLMGIILSFDEKPAAGEVQKNLHILDGVKAILRIPAVRVIVLIDLLLLIFVNIYYRVAFFPKIAGLGLDVQYFGIVDVLTLAFTSLLLFLLPRVSWKNDRLTLALFSLTAAVLFVLFGLSRTLAPALIFGMLFDPVWNLRRHVLPPITNKYFEDHNRALNLSSMSFVSNLGSALLVPAATVLFARDYRYSLIPLALMLLLLLKFPQAGRAAIEAQPISEAEL